MHITPCMQGNCRAFMTPSPPPLNLTHPSHPSLPSAHDERSISPRSAAEALLVLERLDLPGPGCQPSSSRAPSPPRPSPVFHSRGTDGGESQGQAGMEELLLAGVLVEGYGSAMQAPGTKVVESEAGDRGDEGMEEEVAAILELGRPRTSQPSGLLPPAKRRAKHSSNEPASRTTSHLLVEPHATRTPLTLPSPLVLYTTLNTIPQLP
ncbi:hypothetical protein V8C86DRAFT_322341 [Haematococcus lacustris]